MELDKEQRISREVAKADFDKILAMEVMWRKKSRV